MQRLWQVLLRDERAHVALLLALSLILNVCTALWTAKSAGLPLSHMGVFHDGHLYLEIAKSFPLPYDPEGPAYLGQAPGYPALMALIRLLVPAQLANWGMIALLAAWLPAALSTVAFYALCRETETPPIWPSLLFVVANPRWVSIASFGYPEPLAMLLCILCLLAYQRHNLGLCVALLGLALLARFPAVLVGGAIAFGTLLQRGDRNLRAFAWLALPLGVLAAWNLYLFVRVPGFAGVWEAHKVFWDVHWTWPFAGMIGAIDSARWSSPIPTLHVSYGSLAFYLTAIVVGLRRSERKLWVLPVWIALIVMFHVSLSGEVSARAFPRFAILAWPCALLVIWRAVGSRVPNLAAAGVCLAAAVFSVTFSESVASWASSIQHRRHPHLAVVLENLDSDVATWPQPVREPTIPRGVLERRGQMR